MEPNKAYNFLHSEGNHQQQDSLQNGKNIFHWCYQEGVNIWHTETAHISQYWKNKEPNQEVGEDLDIFPKEAYR